MLECIQLICPGPHVILLVMDQSSFTGEDVNVLEGASDHTIVLFTHGDRKDVDQRISDVTGDQKFKENDFAGYHVFDNYRGRQTSDPDGADPQVEELLVKITEMVAKNKKKGKEHYSNEMFEKAVEVLNEVQAAQKSSAAEASTEENPSLITVILEKTVPGSTGVLKFLQEWAMKLMPK